MLYYEPIGLSPYQRKVKALQPVGFYSLAETAGTTAYDLSGNLYHGTSASIVRTDPERGFLGPDGSRVGYFDGAASYVDFNAISSSSANAEFTLSLWAAIDEPILSGTTKAQICRVSADTANSYSIEVDTTAQQVSGYYYAGGTYSSTNGPKIWNDPYSRFWPKWNHFALVVSKAGDSAQLWVNGVASSACSSLGTWTGAFSSSGCVIGASQTGAADPFTGFVSNVALFSSALSNDNVLKLSKVP